MNLNKVWGVVLIMISASAFGVMPIFGKYVYENGLNPISLLFFRFTIASLILIFLQIVLRIPFPKGRILFLLILMGVIGYGGQSFTYFTALTLIPAGLVAILLYIFPAMVTVLSVIFLKERVTTQKISALLLALAGTVLVVGFETGGSTLGILYALGAAAFYAGYIVVGAKVTLKYGSFASSTVIIASSAVAYGLVVSTQGLIWPVSSTGWLYLVLIAIFCTVISISTFFAGVKRIGAVNGSILSTLEPVVTVLLGMLIFSEGTSWTRFLGMTLILGGAIVLAKR